MVGKINKRGRLPDGAPNPIDVHVGRQIFARRVELGLSLEKLAGELGLTFQQVQKYERGLNRVSASRLFDFSKILGVSINYFFSGMDVETENFSPRNVRLSQEESVSDIIRDPMKREESKRLAKAYYSLENRLLAKYLYDLMVALSRPNEKEAE